jgi:hypothetical protein
MYGTIHRGTTPDVELMVPYDTRLIEKVYVTWTQEGQVVLEMDVADVVVGEGRIWVPMTQEDTLAFAPGFALMQVRALFSDGAVVTSAPATYRIMDALKEGVIS